MAAGKPPRPRQSVYMGHAYRISWAPRGTVKQDDGTPCWGLTDTDTHTIHIERGMRPTKEREIVLHEVLHQLYDSSVLSEVPAEVEEPLVTYLGRAIGAHMEENLELWEYLLALSKSRRASK